MRKVIKAKPGHMFLASSASDSIGVGVILDGKRLIVEDEGMYLEVSKNELYEVYDVVELPQTLYASVV
jgi:hypothetical protein